MAGELNVKVAISSDGLWRSLPCGCAPRKSFGSRLARGRRFAEPGGKIYRSFSDVAKAAEDPLRAATNPS